MRRQEVAVIVREARLRVKNAPNRRRAIINRGNRLRINVSRQLEALTLQIEEDRRTIRLMRDFERS